MNQPPEKRPERLTEQEKADWPWKIPLTKGQFAIVDEVDLAELSKYQWHYVQKRTKGYASRRMPTCKTRGMHRDLLGLTDASILGDHINGDGLDNRRCNLRAVSHLGNTRNRGPQKTNGLPKGVSMRNGRYEACISVAGERQYLGRYDTPDQAAIAYNAAAIVLFGPHAYLNDIGQSSKQKGSFVTISAEEMREELGLEEEKE